MASIEENITIWLVTIISFYGCKVWGGTIPHTKWAKIDVMQKTLLTNDVMIKQNIVLAKTNILSFDGMSTTWMINHIEKVKPLKKRDFVKW